MPTELVNVQGLGNGQYVVSVDGTLVRCHIAETTSKLGMIEQSVINAYQAQAWACDAAGLPATASPANPGYYAKNLTVEKDKIGEFGSEYLLNLINQHVLQVAERAATLLNVAARTRLFLAEDQ